jgi:hypothetical protein
MVCQLRKMFSDYFLEEILEQYIYPNDLGNQHQPCANGFTHVRDTTVHNKKHRLK